MGFTKCMCTPMGFMRFMGLGGSSEMTVVMGSNVIYCHARKKSQNSADNARGDCCVRLLNRMTK
jgi:hypothetical protein